MCQLQPPDSGPPPIFTAEPSAGEPIRVTRKIKGRKQPNVFLDNRGFTDQSHEFDTILHNVKGGPILRRRKHPAPPLDDIDPRFHAVYDESLHGDKLRKELDLSHLPIGLCTKVYALFQKYWSVFDDKGKGLQVFH